MRRTVVMLAVVALVLGGCGGDDDPGSLAASTTTTSPGTTTTSREALTCEMVAFTPDSEDAASDIRATGLSCEEAEAFVAVAGRRTSSGGPQELDVEGYRCIRVANTEDPLPQSSYECTNGPKQVTFVRS